MRIVKITEPREGFVYDINHLTFVVNSKSQTAFIGKDPHIMYCGQNAPPIHNKNPIGKIGITHRIQDGKLVEIPRREIEVGDVYANKAGGLFFISKIIGDNLQGMWSGGQVTDTVNIGMTKEKWIENFKMKKVGIISITHEINWDKE